MPDIQFIRDHQKEVKKAARDKQLNPKVVDEVLRLDSQRRKLRVEVEKLRAERNKVSKLLASKQTKKLKEQAGTIKKRLKDIEPQLRKTEKALE